ncbi:MAG: hypothetical protein ACTSUE_17705 [Promethearchaeota archaeon]
MTEYNVLRNLSKTISLLNDESQVALAWLNFGEEVESKNFDPSIPAFKALHIFQKIKDGNGIAKSAFLIARHLFAIEHFEHSLNYLDLGLKAITDSKDLKLKSYLLSRIGAVEFHLKNYQRSLKSYTGCVELLEELGELNEIPKIFGAMAFIYQDLGDGDQANQLFVKAAEYATKAGNDEEAERYTSFIM